MYRLRPVCDLLHVCNSRIQLNSIGNDLVNNKQTNKQTGILSHRLKIQTEEHSDQKDPTLPFSAPFCTDIDIASTVGELVVVFGPYLLLMSTTVVARGPY